MITYCLLGYFRISMWPVKTSAWSVSGLKEIHRFERDCDTHQSKTFFLIGFKKDCLIILLFQYFFINLPMLTTSETIGANADADLQLV